MLEYSEILRYLAKNPPQMDAERELHASLLELLAKCLRMNERIVEIGRRPPQGRFDRSCFDEEERAPRQRRLAYYPQQRRLPVS